jgi:hypothetical protein
MAATLDPFSGPDKYRTQADACDVELREQLAQISADIADPVLKLRYLRSAVGGGERIERHVKRVPIPPLRRVLYRLRGLQALQPLADDATARISVNQRTLEARKSARYGVVGTLAAGMLFLPALMATLAFSIDPKPQPASAAFEQVASRSSEPVAPVRVEVDTTPAQPAEALPPDTIGLAPTTIWLADRGPGWELYSNGLRIETTYTVAGEPRKYRIHDRKTGIQPTWYSHPVGLLFHTSESDLWPLEADYGQQLRQSSTQLLKYVARTKAYNYMIDRFGRVYRMVDDETRASHAGHSIWARGDDVYLDLNSAFLGISFESRWEGGHTLPITRAQLVAGRNLTNYLRQRFAIAPEMCVTHGLTSISPKNYLIGYHRDWARGFPFEAFGLPDLYAQAPPSVSMFGFTYDREFVRVVGDRWPGLVAAEAALKSDAAARHVSTDVVRLERRALYNKWIGQIRDDATVAGETPVTTASNSKRG